MLSSVTSTCRETGWTLAPYTVLAIMLRKIFKLDGAGNTDFSIEDCIEQALQPVIPQAQEKGIDLI
jgi:hypothetical protein